MYHSQWFSMNSLQTESLKFYFVKNIQKDMKYEQILNKQETLKTALFVPDTAGPQHHQD